LQLKGVHSWKGLGFPLILRCQIAEVLDELHVGHVPRGFVTEPPAGDGTSETLSRNEDVITGAIGKDELPPKETE
jgi:hypothetical protein